MLFSSAVFLVALTTSVRALGEYLVNEIIWLNLAENSCSVIVIIIMFFYIF